MTDAPKEAKNDSPPHPETQVTPNNLVEVVHGLRLKLQETTDPRITVTKEKFEFIYMHLLEAASRIVKNYRAICTRNGLDPGKIRLYMVGGRVKGKPLKEDSDIDLLFCVENYRQSPENFQFARFPDAIDAYDFKLHLMNIIRKDMTKICEEMGLPDEFHVLSYGSTMPNQTPEDTLLLCED